MQITKANSNRAPIAVIYGNEGRGKTTLASKFPHAVWFLLERGLPHGVEVEAAEGVDSFEGVMNGLRHLYSVEHTYQTLVVDILRCRRRHHHLATLVTLQRSSYASPEIFLRNFPVRIRCS